jgi:hypothetical protein
MCREPFFGIRCDTALIEAAKVLTSAANPR